MIFLIKGYKNKKNRRNLNLYIMKNGVCIEGKVLSIYDNFSISLENSRGYHNVTAKVQYQQNNESKVIVVDGLCLNINKLKSYMDKKVNVYIYKNLSYVDIVND